MHFANALNKQIGDFIQVPRSEAKLHENIISSNDFFRWKFNRVVRIERIEKLKAVLGKLKQKELKGDGFQRKNRRDDTM